MPRNIMLVTIALFGTISDKSLLCVTKNIMYVMAIQQMQVSIYGIYVPLFLLILLTASFKNNPLRMILTACRQNCQSVGNHLVHFLACFSSSVNLVEHLAVLNKKYA